MRVFVTGLGVVSGIGLNVEENIAALRERQHGMGKVTLFPTALDVPVSEVKRTNEELKDILCLDPNRTYSRTALLGMLAAQEAILDSEVNPVQMRVGLISSTSVGGMDRSEQFYNEFRENPGHGRLREVISHDCGASTEQIADYLWIKDYVTTISTACSSAGNAIMLGARLIKSGQLDAVVVGGTDALCRFTMNGFNSLMILDKEHCRPFDESRAGLNLGEGAGYLVLQSEDSLNSRQMLREKFFLFNQTASDSQDTSGNKDASGKGASGNMDASTNRGIYAELTGYANVNEAYHQTGSSPEGDGAFLSMTEAISMSGIDPSEISYINVHGTGTPGNDASEGKALRRIFGEQVPPFSSVKAFIGHTLGASEGIEAVYSVLALKHGYIYPNLNFQTPIADTRLVPETEFREGVQIKHVLSNSFGFGGNNSSVLFSANDIL